MNLKGLALRRVYKKLEDNRIVGEIARFLPSSVQTLSLEFAETRITQQAFILDLISEVIPNADVNFVVGEVGELRNGPLIMTPSRFEKRFRSIVHDTTTTNFK